MIISFPLEDDVEGPSSAKPLHTLLIPISAYMSLKDSIQYPAQHIF